MSTIACPSCNDDISAKAFDCPKCGHPVRKPTRGFFGKLVKWGFIGFNVLMLLWVVGGGNAAVETQEGLSGAELAGAQIGTGIGIFFLLGIWFAGAVVLGLFVLVTRPRK